MRIGIDFDNTIACYDGVFHKAAVERGLIPSDVHTDKTSVRNYLREIDREEAWTELQGYVYGARMDLVAPYPGVKRFVSEALAGGHSLFIISHKTKSPYLGPRYDLHDAARSFLSQQSLVLDGVSGIAPQNAFFEVTLVEKLARIRAQKCDVFIDDLPELLEESDFPNETRGILFDPLKHYPDGMYKGMRYESYPDWATIRQTILH